MFELETEALSWRLPQQRVLGLALRLSQALEPIFIRPQASQMLLCSLVGQLQQEQDQRLTFMEILSSCAGGSI